MQKYSKSLTYYSCTNSILRDEILKKLDLICVCDFLHVNKNLLLDVLFITIFIKLITFNKWRSMK